jgi:serine/threonine protein kinase
MQPGHGHDPLIGQILENLYLVEELIAQGGMGSIYRAMQMRLNFPVAVKVLKPELVSDEKILKRFIREALAVSQLRHPHVVQLYDAGRTPSGVHFIVMEYLPGLSLDRRIMKDRRVDPIVAMTLASQAAAALGMAHRKGIIHRDLKPANIFLVDAEGMDVFAKVLDFGIAKFHPNTGEDMTKLTQAGSTMGTPHYMAPEQIQGHEVGRWADIYSLGVILWETAIGAPPFKGDSPMEVFMGHIEDPLPAVKKVAPGLELPHGFEDILKKALQKRPMDRFQTMESFKEALDACLRGGAVSAGGGNRTKSAVMPAVASQPLSPASAARNNQTLIYALAGMGVVIIVLIVLLILLSI